MNEGQLGSLVISLQADIARFREDLGKANALNQKAMKQMAADTRDQTQLMSKSMEGFATAAKLSIAGFSAQEMITQLLDAGKAAERMKNSFAAATGSMGAGASAIAFVRAESMRLGIDLQQAADGYMKIAAASKGTALEGKATQDVFRSVAGASTALGLSAEQTNGALLAISQMMSKGTVQAEELRGQLGERIPGAFQIAARAMGVSTAELDHMLKAGKVVAEDFLPKFAAELEKTFTPSAEAVKGLNAETNRLKTAIFDFKAMLMDKGGNSLASSIIGGAALGIQAWADVLGVMADETKFKFQKLFEWMKNERAGVADVYNIMNGGVPRSANESRNSAMRQAGLSALLSEGTKFGSEDNLINIGRMSPQASTGAASRGNTGGGTKVTYNRSEDLLLKNILAYSESMKGQEQAFFELGQDITRSAEAASTVFNIATMQTGELKTDRYKVTPLSKYRLMTNEQYSKNQFGETPAELADRLQKEQERIVEMQREIEKTNPWVGAATGISEYAAMTKNLGDQMNELAYGAMKRTEDALVQMAMTGKASFRDMANSIISDLVRIAMRQAITGPLAQGLSSVFGGAAWTSQYGSDAAAMANNPPYLPGRAGGGSVASGSSYLIGERGPEILTMGAGSGYVTPNHALGKSAAPVINIINNAGSDTKVSTSQPRFDAGQWVVDAVISKLRSDPGTRAAFAGGGNY